MGCSLALYCLADLTWQMVQRLTASRTSCRLMPSNSVLTFCSVASWPRWPVHSTCAKLMAATICVTGTTRRSASRGMGESASGLPCTVLRTWPTAGRCWCDEVCDISTERYLFCASLWFSQRCS